MPAQALLKRNPKFTAEQFSDAWLEHARLVVPLFLWCGVEVYVQTHAPLTLANPAQDLNISDYDGAATTHLTPSLLALVTKNEQVGIPGWVRRYYEEVVLVDERRVLVGEAMGHVRMVDEGEGGEVVKGGKRIVVIEKGELAEGFEGGGDVWKRYEREGKGEVEGEKEG
ncbi:hypothetical protein GLAREA_03892 [Glarea lozoyensis ATCC 20868]|uniref:EthD domain-containing protein n=1 Tax=Glarea lozoyensis (strain ATCC 20868 / MF5171) TaxID=1116229 RepID=S3CZ94_GLAL2|nr:uncharacterized protein GLAREA_03892 [Glarea lozoyensis ATCC 20868]EPE30925.1 hypothetical protein GLAREA_03892 [Glarea lozoyensis ATCC 20868]